MTKFLVGQHVSLRESRIVSLPEEEQEAYKGKVWVVVTATPILAGETALYTVSETNQKLSRLWMEGSLQLAVPFTPLNLESYL